MKKRALISVSNKEMIVAFSKALIELNIEILSTGGTFTLLKSKNIPVTKVSNITNFPEILSGRVKTLHPNIYGGILAKRTKADSAELDRYKIGWIDFVIVNFYPFEKIIKKDSFNYDNAIENIDIGGPTMLRSAAKNHQYVVPIVDVADYEGIINELKISDEVSPKTRQKLALKAFQHTAYYDNCIANYLSEQISNDFPEHFMQSFSKKFDLRYGENPHQRASFYEDKNDRSFSIRNAIQLSGKELSYNNIIDLDSSLNILCEFIDSRPFACIIKHTNPCGAAYGNNIKSAYKRAVDCDPISYFGGIVAVNREVDEEMAIELNKSFLECIISPNFSKKALALLKKKRNLRLLTINSKLSKKRIGKKVYQVSGALLVQDFDDIKFHINASKCVTKKSFELNVKDTLEFAWKLVKHIKSNAIILAKDGQTIGIGAGQMSRIDSINIAISKAKANGFDSNGSVLASDAFFPFRDSIDSVAKAGVSAIIQPGGSIRDNEVIHAANENEIAMLFTEKRHFNH